MKIAELLTRFGVRPTRHRTKIAEFLFEVADHPTADEVLAWAQGHLPKVSRATIYNTLNELVAARLVRQVHLPGEARSVYDCNIAPHFHFLDIESGRVIDIPASAVKLDVAALSGYEVVEIDVVLKGRLTRRRTAQSLPIQ